VSQVIESELSRFLHEESARSASANDFDPDQLIRAGRATRKRHRLGAAAAFAAIVAAAIAVPVSLAGGDGNPDRVTVSPGPSPTLTPSAEPSVATKTVDIGPYSLQVPATWTVEPMPTDHESSSPGGVVQDVYLVELLTPGTGGPDEVRADGDIVINVQPMSATAAKHAFDQLAGLKGEPKRVIDGREVLVGSDGIQGRAVTGYTSKAIVQVLGPGMTLDRMVALLNGLTERTPS
jgi:hypothetical protein